MVDPNTRQGKRTPVTLKIKFKSETVEQFIERYAVDVSQGGIFIRTKEPLAVGTQMKFEFQLRDASPLIAGEGTVVWTRENDPGRPAIAPGMGVRFDRLADGSQSILERILAEKAKQAPTRPQAETTKPPLFTDTPTRVAPAPMQDALLGKDNGRQRRPDEPHGESHTPLPRPMPFHSDADEFPDEAFEEATKVRALDELIAATADGASQDEAPTTRRGNGRADAAVDSVSDRAETLSDGRSPPPLRPDGARLGDGHDGPDLPHPPAPELGMRPAPRLLDTSPSPRFESPLPPPLPAALQKTQLGVEPARARISTPPPFPPAGLPPTGPLPVMPMGGPPMGGPMSGPTMGGPMSGASLGGPSSMEAPPLPSGMRAVATEHTEPARLPSMRSRSPAPLLILILVLVAAGAAAVWFLVLRPQAEQRLAGPKTPVGSGATPGSAVAATGSGATGSGSAGVAPAPKPEVVATIIEASVEGATVAITGTDQTGSAPFTAKLEKGKAYKARITARGFVALELDVKGGDDKLTARLVAKPRVLSIDSEPRGAVILVDSGATGHTTPFDVELTAAQAAKKTVRVQLRKTGYRGIDRQIELARFAEEDTRMVSKLEERLAVLPPPTVTSHPGAGSGSAKPAGSDAGSGSGSDGAGTPTAGSGSDAPATGSGSVTPPTPPAAPTAGSGSAAEPEPEFNKKSP